MEKRQIFHSGDWMKCRVDEGYVGYKKATVGEKTTFYLNEDGINGFINGIFKINRPIPQAGKDNALKAIKRGILNVLNLGGGHTITIVDAYGRKLMFEHHFKSEEMPTKEEMRAKIAEVQKWLLANNI